MEESTDSNPALERLHRQRAHKRGQVTKVHKKISSLNDSHPDDMDAVTVKLLSEELSTAVSAHDVIQSHIDELLVDDSAAFDLEVIERDKHCELHTELRRTLMLLEESHQLWPNSNCVVEEMDTLSAVSDKTSPSFQSMFENFSNNCKPFLNSARAHHAHLAFRERLQSLRVARDKFCRHACTSSEFSSPVLSFPHPFCSIPKGAPIPVKVPSFNGNPLHWEKFESEFSTAIRTRAPHYSNFDVRCLLTSQSQEHHQASPRSRCSPSRPAACPEERVRHSSDCWSHPDREVAHTQYL